MIFNQKRVRGLSKLKNLEKGIKIRVAVKNPERSHLSKMGFERNLNIGDSILPKVIGPASRLNAEGKHLIHKDREKEINFRMVEWSYKQFNGPGIFKEVTESIDIPYKRYPRTLIAPYSIEFSIDEENRDKYLTSPEFELGSDDEKIIVSINLLLEYFGYCEVLFDKFQSSINGELKKLNWKVLPKGEFPWEIQKIRIDPFLSNARGNNREVIENRLKAINNKKPDFTAVGQGGFEGYLVYGFSSENLYVLESVEVNNATYVLAKNWEYISKLSKAEILRNELYEYRLIHNKNWYKKLDEILK